MPVGPSTRFILAIALQSASKGKYVLFAHRQRTPDGEFLPILKRVKRTKPKKTELPKQKAPQNPKKLKLKSLHTIEDLARSHKEKQARLIYSVPIGYRPEAVPELIRDREMNVMLLDGIYLDTPLKAKYVCIPVALDGTPPDEKVSVCGVVFLFKRVSDINFWGNSWNVYERSNAQLELPPFRGVVLVYTKKSWAPKFAYDCNLPKPTVYELMRRHEKEKERKKPRWIRNHREEYREGSVWHIYTPMGGDSRYKMGGKRHP